MNPKINITYCVPCGYERRANALAEALSTELGVEASLIKGGGGIFKVTQGDKVLAARTRDHFPTTEEIVEAVKAALAE